ncbi:VolA/Pla-1 family phospholipase [Photobacterium sp. J15]|uniref:VolA/Pla-1 family phospholipase n=1 Tax=Photobacterium sp. J15 TaxID=265901 RepID=UPI0007E3F376|nr:VolA/Pla-1 family phospholipase [Photobacterium sp. J15]
MKKNVLALLIASSIGLYGCGDESELTGNPSIDPGIEKSLQAETKIEFNILPTGEKKVITPSFLVMDTTDGTLATDKLAKDPSNFSDPMVTMGKTDGWSTTQPIVINFTGNDLASSTAPNSFYLIKSSDPRAGVPSEQPTVLTEGTDYKVIASGKKLTALLLKPLDPASNYMFAVTDDLKDIKGHSVGMTGSYGVLKTKSHPPSEELVPAQKIVHAVEHQFDIAGVNADSIIYSSWFTTASVGDVMFAAKSASALALQSPNKAHDVWKGSAISSNVVSTDLDKLFGMVPDQKPVETTTDGNEIYTGTIYLPYFLETAPNKFNNTPWQSGMPSLAKISAVLTDKEHNTYSAADQVSIIGQLSTLPIPIVPEDLEKAAAGEPEAQKKVLTALTGATLTLANGDQLDTERLITRYSPVPKLKSVEPVEYTLVLPSKAECQGTATNTVSIFQHGITVDKTVLTETIVDQDGTKTTLADGIIGDQCHAIFAIDHPLHGTRGIKIPGQDDLTASDHPEMYLNLANLPVARDNLRQSTIDLVNLRMSIGLQQAALAKILSKEGELSADDLQAINAMGVLARLNPSKGVSYSGHSLGGITGVTLGNIANIPTAPDTETDEMLFNINTLALANPGAGIPYLLLESGKFAPFVKGSIIGSYQDEEDAKVKIGDSFRSYCIDNAISDAAKCYYSYENALINKGDELSMATLGATYELFSQFAYAAQSVLDTVDPINHSMKIDKKIAVYLSEVKGDATIPNKLVPFATVEGTTIAKPYSPFGGTEPLMATMKLAPTTASINSDTVRNAVLFNKGEHSSLLGKGDANVTTEMHKQLSSLLNDNGQTLTIHDSTVIDAMPDPIQ